MATYLHPGVYVEEIPSGSKPIEAVSTSVAALVGPAVRGPVGEPVIINGFDDYVAKFGPITSERDVMGLAVSTFFQNGGKHAYVARLLSDDSATKVAAKTVIGEDSSNEDVIRIEATSPAYAARAFASAKRPTSPTQA